MQVAPREKELVIGHELTVNAAHFLFDPYSRVYPGLPRALPSRHFPMRICSAQRRNPPNSSSIRVHSFLPFLVITIYCSAGFGKRSDPST